TTRIRTSVISLGQSAHAHAHAQSRAEKPCQNPADHNRVLDQSCAVRAAVQPGAAGLAVQLPAAAAPDIPAALLQLPAGARNLAAQSGQSGAEARRYMARPAALVPPLRAVERRKNPGAGEAGDHRPRPP